MIHLTPRALFCVSIALACVGCGGTSHGGSHTANSFSGGHSSGSSHSSSSSYGSGSAYRSSSSSSSGSSRRSGEGSSRGVDAARVGAAVVLGALDIATRSRQGYGDTAVPSAPDVPPPRLPSACEEALGDWRDIHPDPATRVPPQLRCGPNGEWGGEWSPQASPPPPAVAPVAPAPPATQPL